jgi:glycosyltransferase involved in cell wall biosynthesis
MKMLQVWLFLHGSADYYGSDKVLLTTVQGVIDGGLCAAVVVLHEYGPLVGALRNCGAEVHVADVGKISRAIFTLSGLFKLPTRLWLTVRALDRIVAGRQVHLVYSNTLAVLGGALWARWRSRPHVWHAHEMPSRPALVRRGLPRIASWLSDRVIANSTQTRLWLLDQAPALASRATVVFNGLPAINWPLPTDVQSFRDSHGIADEDVLVVLVGRINWMKGQGLLIEALAQIQQAGRLGRLHALLVGGTLPGKEAMVDELKSKIEAGQLAARVRILPFTEDIFTVWKAADIAVVPSTEPEAFGLVAIEAMAAGRPVAAAAHGGLLDVVEDGVTGLLFKPCDAAALAEALLRLAEDGELRQRMGMAGAQRQARLFDLVGQQAKIGEICVALASS